MSEASSFSTTKPRSTIPPAVATPQEGGASPDEGTSAEITTADIEAESPGPSTSGGATYDNSDVALISPERADKLNQEWQSIQANFVDEPRAAVKQADALVAKTIEFLSQSFSSTRSSLEVKWEREQDVSTEDMRLALQHYRSFFRRLLSI